MTLVLTVTYVLLVMRISNHGEGGIMALLSMLRGWFEKSRTRKLMVLVAMGVFGASLFLGDSMITPAISVLSAVEGLKTVDAGFAEWVVPITAVIITMLFLVQRFGTEAVGRTFGPVMILWFTTLGGLGISGIVHEPGILRALLPTYALGFLFGHFEIAFFAMGAIVLSVTGAEALYADMGHFGRRPISVGWLFLVYPACTLSYLGQGALILHDPKNLSAPFFLLCPDWARIALVVLATAATVIAAQAVITGAFSVAKAAGQLGYLPRLRIVHTSDDSHGQIYVPFVNWLLLVAVLTLVFAFESSFALASAYGMAVTGTITIVVILFAYIAARTWRMPKVVLFPIVAVLLALDLLFLAVNLTKIPHGAWLPVVIALVCFTVMMTWQRGRELVTARRTVMEGRLTDFVTELQDPSRASVVDGTAIFLNRGAQTPLAFRANVEHNHVRHRNVLIVKIDIETIPRVAEQDRVVLNDLGYADDGITHVTLRFGYTETPDVPAALARLQADQTEGAIDLAGATYFLSKIELVPARDEASAIDMPKWRKRLFLATSHISSDAADHFLLPRDRTVLMGAHVDV
ncbi:potassium transporter Kup [Nocardioides montaniterrae]